MLTSRVAETNRTVINLSDRVESIASILEMQSYEISTLREQGDENALGIQSVDERCDGLQGRCEIITSTVEVLDARENSRFEAYSAYKNMVDAALDEIEEKANTALDQELDLSETVTTVIGDVATLGANSDAISGRVAVLENGSGPYVRKTGGNISGNLSVLGSMNISGQVNMNNCPLLMGNELSGSSIIGGTGVTYNSDSQHRYTVNDTEAALLDADSFNLAVGVSLYVTDHQRHNLRSCIAYAIAVPNLTITPTPLSSIGGTSSISQMTLIEVNVPASTIVTVLGGWLPGSTITIINTGGTGFTLSRSGTFSFYTLTNTTTTTYVVASTVTRLRLQWGGSTKLYVVP